MLDLRRRGGPVAVMTVHRMLAAGLLVLMNGAAPGHTQTPRQSIPAPIDEVLWWLPADTETVEVTQTPANPRGLFFDVREPASDDHVFSGPSFADTLTRHLKGVRIKATVDGARRFRPPSGLGSTLYEGASIVRFERPLAQGGSPLLADLRARALKADRVGGLEILEFRDTLEKDTWTFSIAMPDADLLVIATDRAYLEELLRRRSARAQARALPNDLPEWPWVDVTAPYWAVRHYSHDPADLTAPFARNNLVDGTDADALGVTAHVNADGRTVVVHYVSRGAQAEELARRLWSAPHEGVAPAFRRVAPNAIEVRLVARDRDQLSFFLFFVTLGALGHLVYI